MTTEKNRATEIADALAAVRQRLSAACRAAGRVESEVLLLPVTKFFPASDVEILYGLGCREFGESREQDAGPKVTATAEAFASDPGKWHMIGHLQRNKAKSVASWAYSIHSIDSLRLVDALNKSVGSAIENGGRTEPLRALLQVSLDGDVHRGGVDRSELDELAERVAAAPHLTLAGLMAVPPLGSVADEAFEDLARLHERLRRSHPDAIELSAGMTGDLEEAVRHGSTCVRVGTAILGSRPITSPVQSTDHTSHN